MSSTQSPFARERAEMLAQLFRENWRLVLGEGIILAILGMAAIAAAPIAGLVTTLVLGLILIAAGIVGLVSTFGARGMPGFWWALISAILAIIVGGLLIWSPAAGLISLTSLMTAFFIADGIVTIFLALRHRDELGGRWQWLLLNGIIDLVIAGLIIWGLPGSIVWALGIVVGVDLVFGGTALIAIALHMRDHVSEEMPGMARHAT